MIDISRTQTIPRPQKEVWAVLADFGAISTWADNADHSCLLGAASAPTKGVGLVRRIQAGRMTLIETVTTWDEPEVLAYSIEGLPKVVRSVTNEWTLVPSGTSTLTTLTTRVDCGSRPPQKLVARIVAGRLAKASDTMLAGLAHALERTSRQASPGPERPAADEGGGKSGPAQESLPSEAQPRRTPQSMTRPPKAQGDTHV